MGAGSRYNTNSQRGNPQPASNYGGGHTGNGKYRNGGIYSQGFRFKPHPNSRFTPDTQVKYIGSHKDFRGMGKVLERNNKTSRSFICIQMNENKKIVYIHKNNLMIL